MNDKIKQLLEQSGFRYVKDDGIGWAGNYNSSLPKFAELIAAECISIVANFSSDYPLRYKNNLLIEINHRDQIEEMFRGNCVEEIKKHFGVGQ